MDELCKKYKQDSEEYEERKTLIKILMKLYLKIITFFYIEKYIVF